MKKDGVRRPELQRPTGNLLVSRGDTGTPRIRQPETPPDRFAPRPDLSEAEKQSTTAQLQERLERIKTRRNEKLPLTTTMHLRSKGPVIWKRKSNTLQYRGLPSLVRRHGRQKVYRLKGYTTIARVNRKRRREQLSYHRNQLIIWGIVILVIVLFFLWLNPIPKIQEFFKVIGYSL